MANERRLLLVGAGLIGQRHIPYINRFASLGGIVDPAAPSQAVAEKHGVPWFDALEPALDRLRPDGVVLATPNPLHVPQALACIAREVPCLIEKPISDTAASAAQLVKAARAANVPLLVGHHRRHNNVIKRAKAVIDEGQLGSLVTVEGKFWLYKPQDYFDAKWRRQRGAGPTLINLIHDLDLLRHLCGEVVEVMAMEGHAHRGFEVEDSCTMLLRFDSGALGTVSVSDTAVAPWSWEFTSGENPAYPHIPGTAYAIAGTAAALSIPDLKLWQHPGERGWWQPMVATDLAYEANDPLAEQMRHFVAVINEAEQPLVSAEEGLKSLALVEAVKRAATKVETPT